MSLIPKLILSLVVAAIAYTLYNILESGAVFGAEFDLKLLLAFCLATVTSALAAGRPGKSVTPAANNTATGAPLDPARRVRGTVKWFNVTKGFGFIVQDDGEEIFVHFRSIRGEGRRGLRDGQRVSFLVAQSDKGPQAEDVVGEN